MTDLFDRLGVGPWDERAYFDLGETSHRVELLDGSLLVTGAGTKVRQRLASRLAMSFNAAAERSGLVAYQAVNLRLRTDRVVIPDLVVAATDPDGLVVEAAEVKLVYEIGPSTNAIKKQLYADAGIHSLLLAEPEPAGLVLRLFRLRVERYVLAAEARSGQVLRLTEPFPIELAVDTLS
ncbi:Uma2 family endonuclease [Asanoa iriomotensis]|uniref:Putative restriction endonuclease domain-containing protein n=1 Tax=Asanoa iriomotensis TaxID=234613 RepID=A0ABQ4C4V4_9ACTN|nr:Uma2 family endonuclease [Asanoa iriomotensis]GIF57816.1 hypothetical protein Air01nite_39110 [Asanoa iriomotensis]